MSISSLKRREVWRSVLLLTLTVSFTAGAPVLPREARAVEIPVLAEPSSTILISSSTIPAPSSTPPMISDEEIDRFLFHIPSALEEKVKRLEASPVQNLRIPVLFGVALDQLENTWGERRKNGRVHRGTDIIAPRGAFIVSPTDAVVTNVGYDKSGGNFVLTANPGGEQFYYAHLESVAVGVTPGKVLSLGDLIGYVGQTGNARRTTPHLHFGIYYKKVALNPYPHLAQEFSLKERVAALERIVDGSNFPLSIALQVIDKYREFLVEAKSQGFALPKTIAWVMENNNVFTKARLLSVDMKPKTQGAGVRLLQELLIDESAGPAARALAHAGASGYFGARTQNALREFQKISGITPAQGRLGPITRAHILNLLSRNSTSSEMAAQTPQKVQTVSPVTFFDHAQAVRGSEEPSGSRRDGSPKDGEFIEPSFDRDLAVGSVGDAVKLLQQFLIETNTGLAVRALASVGITGYFGSLTRRVLAEYQSATGITPAKGYFGLVTRAQILESLTRKMQTQVLMRASQETEAIPVTATSPSTPSSSSRGSLPIGSGPRGSAKVLNLTPTETSR